MVTAAGLQRPAQGRRGAAAAREVRLRHHRARQGDRHHPLPHPPLPVPAAAAAAARRLPRRALRDARTSRSSRRPCRWSYAPAAGRYATRLSVLDQLIGGAGNDGLTYALATALLGYTARVPARRGRRRVRGRRRRQRVPGGRPGGRGRSRAAAVRRGPAPPAARPDRGRARARRGRPAVCWTPAPSSGERLAAQAARFGAAELVRAAEVVATALGEIAGRHRAAAAARADVRPGPAARRRRRRARACRRGWTGSSGGWRSRGSPGPAAATGRCPPRRASRVAPAPAAAPPAAPAEPRAPSRPRPSPAPAAQAPTPEPSAAAAAARADARAHPRRAGRRSSTRGRAGSAPDRLAAEQPAAGPASAWSTSAAPGPTWSSAPSRRGGSPGRC